MRSGWLRGDFSLHHYRRIGVVADCVGLLIHIPAIYAQWHLGWDYRWSGFLLQAPRELRLLMQAVGYLALALVSGRAFRLRLVNAGSRRSGAWR